MMLVSKLLVDCIDEDIRGVLTEINVAKSLWYTQSSSVMCDTCGSVTEVW